MQKVSFPPIKSGVHVSVAAKEPPERSWSRYKKVLIDNPRDSNLLQRQKLWNFQKLNRGAFRSQVTSLPDIPYRVQPNVVDMVSVGVQADLTTRFSYNLRVIFPNLVDNKARRANQADCDTDGLTGNNAPTPLHIASEDDYSDDFDGYSSADDPGFEFDTVVRKKNIGTMTDSSIVKIREKKRKSVRKRSVVKDKQVTSKSSEKHTDFLTEMNLVKQPEARVKFDVDDHYEETDVELGDQCIEAEQEDEEAYISPVSKVEITETIERSPLPSPLAPVQSPESRVPSLPFFPPENIGQSSNFASYPVSILDFISGNVSNRSRKSEYGNKRRAKFISDPEADRVWFEKIVGDKELIDFGTYENFARSRPECQSDSNNEKYTDLTKGSPRKSFTPKINDNYPVYQPVQSKTPRKPPNNPPANANKGRPLKRGIIYVGKSY